MGYPILTRHLVAISLTVMSILLGSVHSIVDLDTVRHAALVSLQRGALPDSALVAPLLSTGETADSVLAVSVLLAVGDTTRALVSHPQQLAAVATVAADVVARLLLVRFLRGEEIADSLVVFWRRFPSSVAGRRCLLAALEAPSFDDVSVVERTAPYTRAWHGADGARWNAAAGNLLARHGFLGRAIELWWNVLAVSGSAPGGTAAESLLVHVDPSLLSWKDLERLAGALLDSGNAEAALILLTADGLPEEMELLRAKALLLAERSHDGLLVLTRLAESTGWTSAQAAWELATYEKRHDRDLPAARYYLSLADRHPGHYLADNAQWEGAWALERSRHYDEAASAYRMLTKRWPRSQFKDQALLRWGLAAWRRGDMEEAARRWRFGVSLGRTPHGRTALGYWLGKAKLHLGDWYEALSWWTWAAITDSSSFYGSRASERLSARSFRTKGTYLANRYLNTRPDLTVWIRSWSEQEPADIVSYSAEHARALYRCGLIDRATDELSQALSEATPSPFLLCDILETALLHENYRVSTLAAQQLAERFESTSGREAPGWLLRFVYPIPYAEIVCHESASLSLDYRLLAALIRKESYYTRTAVSRANAIGLMQLLPSTASQTASRVPQTDPQRLTDVLTNVRLGAYYLKGLLLENEGNKVFALASYNAGPHNTVRWRNLLGDEDLALWIETITYGETRDYIKTVFAFWQRYTQLWPPEPRSFAESLRLKPDLLGEGTGQEADSP